jgi:hypothetical protein
MDLPDREGKSAFEIGPALSFRFAHHSVMRGVRLLEVFPQVHVESNGDAHHDQGTDTQDQKPPDHPHS